MLRDGKRHRAQDLANRLGVSQRTVYRDMETLMSSGIPVRGERGVGYQITVPYTLPPLNLTTDELEALHLGIAVMTEASDPDLQQAAQSLADKIDAALPENQNSPEIGNALAIYPFADAAAGVRHMPALRKAVRQKQRLELEYDAGDGNLCRRIVRVLQLEYWGRVWTATVWCETTGMFDVLRVDRIRKITVIDQGFRDEPGKTLADYLRQESA